MIKMVDLYSQYLSMRKEIDSAIMGVVASSDFIKGTEVALLEEELAEYIGVRHCITCGNGTDALILSLMAMDLMPGDEVIVPSFAFASIVEAVLLLGGVPLFTDVDNTNFNIDVKSVERVISDRTKAIVPVHLFGQPCNMLELMEISRSHKIVVIEDNAQSFGALCRMESGKEIYAGGIGDISYTSFFPTKMLGCYGDGGAVFTNNDILAKRVRELSNHGQCYKYMHEMIGFNSRLDTMQAAVLRVKLKHLSQSIRGRRMLAEHYSKLLSDIEDIELPVEVNYGKHVYHQYTIKTKPSMRDDLKEMLMSRGIQSMVYYPMPLFEQPAYCGKGLCDPEMNICPSLCKSVLSLPMYGELTYGQQDEIACAVKAYFNNHNVYKS